eukprot:m.192733 g.192733  ORF g.192733 m.192733 type:complete len:69 (+) comp18274_c0_seq1:70-276(+)
MSNPMLQNQKPNAAKYIKEGANFSKWQRDAGLALVTYALVQKMCDCALCVSRQLPFCAPNFYITTSAR